MIAFPETTIDQVMKTEHVAAQIHAASKMH
jgi:hypothetical protein